MHFEPLTPHHASLLAVLHKDAFADVWDAHAFAGLLAHPGAFGFIALSDKKDPAGFILLRMAADEAEIITMAVLPAHKRQGIARALLDHARTDASARGVVSLFLEVGETNAAARALYEKAGFVLTGQRPGYYKKGYDGSGAPEDALILVCRLGA